ncbi:hypothetical protein, partial [Azospirillum sp. B506]|uniref:hypothetical protein n=1 Tax=Azospirillum sp. B506 TaxID=137721 RepID=UPI0005B28D2D
PAFRAPKEKAASIRTKISSMIDPTLSIRVDDASRILYTEYQTSDAISAGPDLMEGQVVIVVHDRSPKTRQTDTGTNAVVPMPVCRVVRR